jgi:drug/metabolite transporter (DMT)-like permease
MLYAVAVGAPWAALEVLAANTLVAYSPYQVVWTRYVVHLALMVAVWGWCEPRALWHTRRPGYQLARSLLMVTMPVCWISAQPSEIAPSTTLAIFWVSPLLVLAFARVILREHVPGAAWVATALACAAALLVLRPEPISSLGAVLLPAGAAVSFSLYVAMTRSLRTEPLRANLFYTALGVVLALTPTIAREFVMPAPAHLAVMVAVGVLGFATLYALDRMTEAAPIAISAPVLSLQIAFVVVFEHLVSRERPAWRSLAGLAVIAGIAVVMWTRAPALRPWGSQ